MKPTAWLKELPPEEGNGMMMTIIEEVAKEWEEPVIPLYSKGAWVGLTDEEIKELDLSNYVQVVRIVEAKLKEKNG
jgi:hypothetical protein